MKIAPPDPSCPIQRGSQLVASSSLAVLDLYDVTLDWARNCLICPILGLASAPALFLVAIFPHPRG
jgi:hypothetical protein